MKKDYPGKVYRVIPDDLAPAIDDLGGFENITADRAFEEVCHMLDVCREWDDYYGDDGETEKKLKRLKREGEHLGLKRWGE